jgi:hypothetical protein
MLRDLDHVTIVLGAKSVTSASISTRLAYLTCLLYDISHYFSHLTLYNL